MSSQDNLFMQKGFIHFSHHICRLDMPEIEQALARLCDRARNENSGAPGIVSVFEANNSDLLCRIEYLAGSDAFFAEVLVPQLKTLIERQIGQAVNLFKDKCNFKHPGGGGFTPHQDVVAYRPFGSDYQVTAAVMLDAANETNGALEMAHIWGCGENEGEWVTTPRGKLPLLPSYQGGQRNGDISDRLSQTMEWHRIDTAPGDVVLFDSYIPHRSSPNNSQSTRRILFFTFNLAIEGDFYHQYYQRKWAAPDDPLFHVSTPTLHSARHVTDSTVTPPSNR
ncbi:phytanoyl-CoA dioxygenase family protein [Pantoea sp. BS_8]|uniref:phytanoyl-CoA dioxygenase family protein n=1 Tax=Pantoea sp. BS_8 TaxID=3055781 RepID=UPI0035C04066